MSAGISLGTLASVVGIAGGIKSLTSSSGGGGGAAQAQAQQAADPFSSYRAALGTQYSDALKTGASTDITKMPGYSQFKTGVMEPSLEATKRTMAASGQLQSGNEQIALQKQSQQGYYGFMTDYLNRLAQGSGAVNNPAQAASLGYQQQGLADQSFMQGIGGIAQGLKGFASSGSTSGGPGYNYMYSDPTSVGPPVTAMQPYYE